MSSVDSKLHAEEKELRDEAKQETFHQLNSHRVAWDSPTLESRHGQHAGLHRMDDDLKLPLLMVQNSFGTTFRHRP